MRKITMQDIADALNVSRVSVWKVFNNYPGVSESLNQQVISKAQELGYLKSGFSQSDSSMNTIAEVVEDNTDDPITISVVVSRPNSSMFWSNIIHYIAKELAKDNISLLYTYVPSNYEDSYKLPSVLSSSTIQGMIILNIYDKKMLHLLNNVNIPKVFLDTVTSIPIDTLKGDLLLLEGRNNIRKITNHIIDKGCKNIGFIGATEYARTNQERYDGFLTAMNDNNIPVNPDFCLTGNIGVNTYREEINTFLNKLIKMPDAFVCVSDFVANFLLQYLTDKGIKVPDDIAVSGYDGSTEYGDLAYYLTTVQVDTKALGKRLVKQLIYRMNDPDAANEIIYVSFDIAYGESTNIKSR